jgi:hypothetical protein
VATKKATKKPSKVAAKKAANRAQVPVAKKGKTPPKKLPEWEVGLRGTAMLRAVVKIRARNQEEADAIAEDLMPPNAKWELWEWHRDSIETLWVELIE